MQLLVAVSSLYRRVSKVVENVKLACWCYPGKHVYEI